VVYCDLAVGIPEIERQVMAKKRDDKYEMDRLYSDPQAFKARALEEIRRAKRYATFVSLVAIDMGHIDSIDEVENFGNLNDFMVSLRKLIRVSIRETDLLSIAGSGKILILLLDTPREGALSLSERLKVTLRYFMCNNIKSPLNWKVPIKEYSFPNAPEDEQDIVSYLDQVEKA
jgi:GGDEF domain-containing protein